MVNGIKQVLNTNIFTRTFNQNHIKNNLKS